jgi:hypothetical protein
MIRDTNKVPFLTAKDLGASREHMHFRNGKLTKNPPQDMQNEIFCSIEMRNGDRQSLWMRRTEALDRIFRYLFQERRYNQHINFIEWDDRINCRCQDGIYISESNFFMTKEEFAKFRKTIMPYDEVMAKYTG